MAVERGVELGAIISVSELVIKTHVYLKGSSLPSPLTRSTPPPLPVLRTLLFRAPSVESPSFPSQSRINTCTSKNFLLPDTVQQIWI